MNCEWYTPPDIVALAVEVMGEIDLDPASCAAANETVGAKVFHALADDGLLQEWHGRVWLNPPYSKIASFVDKLIDEMASSRVTEAIMLTANSSDAEWFQAAVAWASAICLPARRIKFVSPHGLAPASPPTGQAIFYFGPHVGKFAEVFAPVGRIVNRRLERVRMIRGGFNESPNLRESVKVW
jgi:ParB family chromosome partitioning protein